MNNLNMYFAWKQVVASALVSAVMGCSVPPVGQRDLLAFLQPGTTTRAEVLLKLGPPDASYEQERILTYRLSEDEGGYRFPKSYDPEKYSLVLVFDAKSVLVKRTLVKVRN